MRAALRRIQSRTRSSPLCRVEPVALVPRVCDGAEQAGAASAAVARQIRAAARKAEHIAPAHIERPVQTLALVCRDRECRRRGRRIRQPVRRFERPRRIIFHAEFVRDASCALEAFVDEQLKQHASPAVDVRLPVPFLEHPSGLRAGGRLQEIGQHLVGQLHAGGVFLAISWS